MANELLDEELKNAANEVKKILQGEREDTNITDMNEDQMADVVVVDGSFLDVLSSSNKSNSSSFITFISFNKSISRASLNRHFQQLFQFFVSVH